MSGGVDQIGTVKVPAAGLIVKIGVRGKVVRLEVSRWAVPFGIDLTMAEADELAMALAVAYSDALAAEPVGVVQ